MAVSKHLKVMEQAGLIRRRKDGRVHRCTFSPDAITRANAWIEMHRAYWTQQLDALAAYLEGGPDRGEVSPETPGDDR